jgi:hypothetical protein
MISACLIEHVFILAATILQLTFNTVHFSAYLFNMIYNLILGFIKVYSNGLGMTVEQVRTVLRKQADTLGKSVEANLQLKARYFTVTLVSVTQLPAGLTHCMCSMHTQACCLSYTI